jgi:uncharacterized protein YkwD
MWLFRSSPDTIYSINKPAPESGQNGPALTEELAPENIAPQSDDVDRSSPTPSATPTPTPTPSPRPSTASPRPSRAARSATPRPPARKPRRKPQTTTVTTAGVPEDVAAKTRVVELVNGERGKNGCGPVHADTRLDQAAQGHSADMVKRNYFSHDTPEGVDPWERARAAGYTTPTGENIAAGQHTADDVVTSWMNSPGHRANILNCDSHAIGMGLARSAEGQPYWTQMFGSQ